MNTIIINEDDNVGDGLAKINYNFLNLNETICDLSDAKSENYISLKKFEKLMLWLDDAISYTDYDKLQKLETSVQMLSGYWNKLEFTVQYPFNPSTGFTSILVSGGEFGGLLASTNQLDQDTLISQALVKQKLYETVSSALKGFKDLELLYVYRDDNGMFLSWDFLNYSFLYNLATDGAGNLYYDGRLVDIYKIPYYSAIVLNKNFQLFTEELFANFATKRLSIKGTTQTIDKTSTDNILIIYSKYQRIEEEYLEDEEGEIIDEVSLDVTTYTPDLSNLNTLIPTKNLLYRDKLSKINDLFLETAESNPRLNKLSLAFLDKNYPAINYRDDTIINVVFFLYNLIGYDTNGSTVVRTDYYDQADVSTPKDKIDVFNKKDISLIAPSSNTTFSVYFSKKDSYVERIVNVKYVKQKDVVTKTDPITGKINTYDNHYWEFKNASLGNPYIKKVATVRNDLEQAQEYFTEYKEFGSQPAPQPVNQITGVETTGGDTGDTGKAKNKKERAKEKEKQKREKEKQKEKEKREKQKENQQKQKEKEKEKKEKQKERQAKNKEKEKEKRQDKKEKEKQKDDKKQKDSKEKREGQKNTENNRKKEKTNNDNQVKKKQNEKQNEKQNQDKKDNVKNNKKTEQDKKTDKKEKNNVEQKKDNDKKENANKKVEEKKKIEIQKKEENDKEEKKKKAKKQKDDDDKKQEEKKKKADDEKKKSDAQKIADKKKKDDDDNKKKKDDDDKKKKNSAGDNKGTKNGDKVETKRQKENNQAQAAHKADGGGKKKK